MQYLLFSVLLYGLSGQHWQVVGFGFGLFNPASYCPAPPSFFVVAPSYPVFAAYPPPNLGFFDTLLQAIFAKKGKSYPPPFAYPPPPPPYYPPPPPPYYPPPPQLPSIQDHIIKVHITEDSEEDNEHHHHYHHHNHDHGHKMNDNHWN